MTTPSTTEAEKAAREVVDRLVREGQMRRSEGTRLLRDGLPIILQGFAVARLRGKPEDDITADLEDERAKAEKRHTSARTTTARRAALLSLTTAQFAIAAWEGVQRDLARHLAAHS
ncbi:hypothetical protein AB0I84_00885 [Streptomyces spectabilis]|uniref:hypothetical protein n=1 Tax=Streptomyces spectabilis TaxID=68270 RepID=UPI0034017D7C